MRNPLLFDIFKKHVIVRESLLRAVLKKDPRALLSYYVKKGVLIRVLPGVYTMYPNKIDSILSYVLNGYLGLSYAASYYQLWGHMSIPVVITSMSVRSGIRQTSNSIRFHIVRVHNYPTKGIVIYEKYPLSYISNPARTIVDAAYFGWKWLLKEIVEWGSWEEKVSKKEIQETCEIYKGRRGKYSYKRCVKLLKKYGFI